MSMVKPLATGKFRLDFTLFGARFRKIFLNEGEAISFQAKLKTSGITKQKLFTEAIEMYLANISSRKKKKSQDVDKYSLKLLLALIGEENILLIAINPVHIEKYRSHQINRGLKASTINRQMATIKHFFKMCEIWEFIDKSPTRNISKLGEDKIQKHIWTKDEVDMVLNKLPLKEAQVFTFLYITGARLSSACSLTWGDIDFKERLIWLTTRKGPKSLERKYYFPLSDTLLKLFQEVYTNTNPSDFVFLNENKQQVDAGLYSKRLQRLLKKNFKNHNNLSLHGLRHSLATSLSRKGVPLNDIKTLLGHSSSKVTEGYITANRDDLFKHVI
jgi:site-specific recombinase XerD